MEEIWKPIPEYEGLYEVSNLGRMRSKTGRIKKLTRHKTSGYYFTTLSKKGKIANVYIHKVVCLAFNGPRLGRYGCLHEDDNKLNNTPGNLYWGSGKQNAADRLRNKKLKLVGLKNSS